MEIKTCSLSKSFLSKTNVKTEILKNVALALICVLSCIHITVDAKLHQQERTTYVTSLCSALTGVSKNIKNVSICSEPLLS